jgi:hypothetical protein
MQIAGKPASANPLNSHCDNGPASSPIRTSHQARFFKVRTKSQGDWALSSRSKPRRFVHDAHRRFFDRDIQSGIIHEASATVKTPPL